MPHRTPRAPRRGVRCGISQTVADMGRSEEHTSELQSHSDLVCRLLLEKKKHDDPRLAESRVESGGKVATGFSHASTILASKLPQTVVHPQQQQLYAKRLVLCVADGCLH